MLAPRPGVSGGLVQRDYATGGSGKGVRGPIDHLSRLLGGVRFLQRRAGILCQQGPAERSPTLPRLSGSGEAGTNRGRPARVPCRDLRQLRWPGDGALCAAQRQAGVLQLLLRQGQGRHADGVGEGLTSTRKLATHEPT